MQGIRRGYTTEGNKNDVVEIMYNKEDREPPDEADRAALIDEIRTEPFAVWYGSKKKT